MLYYSSEYHNIRGKEVKKVSSEKKHWSFIYWGDDMPDERDIDED
jgi:hypothetical protein